MAGLTRERIVDAALDLLDEQGIDGLTVRALASRLGVRAPALYWHVRDKTELLDEMGTEIRRRITAALPAAPDRDWILAVGDYARAVRSIHLQHRDGARTFSGTRLTDPAVLAGTEPWLAAVTGRGVELATVVAAVEVLDAFTIGFVIEEQERAQSAPERYDPAVREEALRDAPLVRASGALIFADSDQRFERDLAVVLAGIAATSRGSR